MTTDTPRTVARPVLLLIAVLAAVALVAAGYAWGAQGNPAATTSPAPDAGQQLELHPEWGGWDVQLTECAHHDDVSTHAVVRFERDGSEADYIVECYG
ncbi:hypothetical protein ACFWH7_19560 [Cellulosimicrobium cellulans]|uniref:hypothetical protein n=1 Tax=Cellulosimicrobium cellulans TaxID=1710 RepID=UPI00365545DA